MEFKDELWWIPVYPPHSSAPSATNEILDFENPVVQVLGRPMVKNGHVSSLTMHKRGGSAVAPSSETSGNSGNPSTSSGNHSEALPSSLPVLGRATGLVFGRNVGFAGQVFGIYSTTRVCLAGMKTYDKEVVKKVPFLNALVQGFAKHVLRLEDHGKEPAVHFFLDADDAMAYVRRMKLLNVNDMEVGSVPLHFAYTFFKERPSLFKFTPAKKQVQLAKKVLNKPNFEGVPIFTSHKLAVLVVGPDSVRWFRPYFFKKEELDGLIKSSMENHYQSLIVNRRAQRRNQMSDLPPDMVEDDMDMLESQDVQDFMEDMDEWGPFLESIMAKAARLFVQDALDKAVFGNKWCRMVAGIQPRFPISVDSFERRIVGGDSSELPPQLPTRISEAAAAPGSNWLLDKFGLDWNRTEVEPPHLTVVAGISGSTHEQVIQAANTAIEQSKDMIANNKMPLDSLFIAELGGPQGWS